MTDRANRTNITNGLFLIVLFLFFGVCIILALIATIQNFKDVANSFEQREQAIVIGKRKVLGSGASHSKYVVAFELSDGSAKEICVNIEGSNDKERRSFYDSIHMGDTGTLTYREMEDIEKKYKEESRRWYGRRFINFEKDSLDTNSYELH